MKQIVLDSSTIISLSERCFSKTIKKLAKKEGITFHIPYMVYEESVLNPIKIRRFELNALRIENLIKESIIEVHKTTPELQAKINTIKSIVGSMFSADRKNIDLIHAGEVEALALMKSIDANILAIDERTTRMLIEEPQNMCTFLSRRHNRKIVLNRNKISLFKEFIGTPTVVRSVELLSLAYDRGCFDSELPSTKEALEAALFSVKYAGCATSADEILSFLKVVK